MEGSIVSPNVCPYPQCMEGSEIPNPEFGLQSPTEIIWNHPSQSTAGRLLAAQRLPTATADVAAGGQLAQEAEDQGGFARAHRTWKDIKIGDFG
jgi:hypothetical protein